MKLTPMKRKQSGTITAMYLNPSWGFVLHTARRGELWILAGLIISFIGYQYNWLGLPDLFWFRCNAASMLMYSIGIYFFKKDKITNIIFSIFVGLAINNFVKEFFGVPTEFNIYDYYGALVTILLVIYGRRGGNHVVGG